MANRKRNIQMNFYVTENKKRLIDERIKLLPYHYGRFPRTPLRTGLTSLDVSGSPDVSLTFLRVTYRDSQCRVPLSCAYAQSWRFPIVFCHLNL